MRLFTTMSMLLAFGLAGAQIPTPAPVAQPSPSGSGSVARPLDPPPGNMPFVHDPSTVIQFHGRYYVYTTGRGIPMLSSPDLVNWTRPGSVFAQIPERVRAEVPKNNGVDVWAPDIIRVGDTFYLYYAVSSWGSFRSVVALATNTTLDPADPAYKWVDRGVVVRSDGVEDMNDIDPGVVRAPDGSLWMCYGSYHGSIEVMQLDPATGLGVAGAKAVAVARQSEAADIIAHDGYFYLFVNHGSCCKGKNSEYNIRVGRSRAVTGPYVDKQGVDLVKGGGSLFLAAHDHRIGPGHFGRVIEETETKGMERFSLHYEADLLNTGRATLGIRPLLWGADGWPAAGDHVAAGVYQILSAASEDTLQIRRGQASEAAGALLLGRYLAVEDQQWSIEPGGGGFYKVVNAGTKTALGAAADGTLEWAGTFSGADAQLWRLEQATDGSYRILNKAAGNSLTSGERGKLSLTSDVADERQHWVVTSP